MSQLAYRKHLQRQVVFGARILKQRARRFNFMRCGNRWNVRLRNVRLTSTRLTSAYLIRTVHVIALEGRSCIRWLGLRLNSGCGKWIDVVLVIDDKHL